MMRPQAQQLLSARLASWPSASASVITKQSQPHHPNVPPRRQQPHQQQPLPLDTPALPHSRQPASAIDTSELKGFLPLPVQLYPDSHRPSITDIVTTPTRYLYYRPHRPTADDDVDVPADRTLLVVNVPFYYTSGELSELFGCFGEVESAVILGRSTQHKPPVLLASLDQSVYETAAVMAGLDVWQPGPPQPYYRSARVIFTSATSVTTATSLSHSIADSIQPHIPPPPTQPLGLPLLLAHYSRQHPPVDKLRDSVNRFMAAFDAQEQQRAAEQRNTAHDDGWTTVRTKRSGRLSAEGNEEDRLERLEQWKRREDKKRAAVTGLSFYRFQGAEKKQAHLVELRRKFGEDKAKVAAMRANRKFKPV